MVRTIKKIMITIAAKAAKLGVIFICLLVTTMFSACSTRKAEKEPVNAVILDGRKHANIAELNVEKAEKFIGDVCNSYGYISIITVDGEPFLHGSIDVPEQKKNLSAQKQKDIAEKQKNEIMEFLQQNKAKTPQVDTLAALQMGARALEAQEGKKRMLIMDSGLQTKGLVDFSQSLLENVEPDKIVEQLKNDNAIPELQGAEVIWIGLGETCAPQSELQQKHRENLQNVWEAILVESGANVTFYSDVAVKKEADETLPYVNTVQIAKQASVLTREEIQTEMKEITVKNISYKFDEESISFKPNTAELLTSKKNVKKVLEPITNYLIENRAEKIFLAGTTASVGTQEGAVALSEKRCETVKKIIVEAGVNKNQIQVIGMGYENPFTIPDRNEDNSLDEKRAKKNRSVIVMSADSDTAKVLCKYKFKQK